MIPHTYFWGHPAPILGCVSPFNRSRDQGGPSGGRRHQPTGAAAAGGDPGEVGSRQGETSPQPEIRVRHPWVGGGSTPHESRMTPKRFFLHSKMFIGRSKRWGRTTRGWTMRPPGSRGVGSCSRRKSWQRRGWVGAPTCPGQPPDPVSLGGDDSQIR